MKVTKINEEKEHLSLELKMKNDQNIGLLSQISTLNSQISALNDSLKKAELVKPSSMPSEEVQNELKRKDILLNGYQEDIKVKKKQLEELDKILGENEIKIRDLENKLSNLEKRPAALADTSPRFYPATEIRQKVKVFVNLRLNKNEKGEYQFEVTSLKDKRATLLKGLDFHLHEARKDCLIVEIKGKVNKLEVFECEFAENIVQTYKAILAETSIPAK